MYKNTDKIGNNETLIRYYRIIILIFIRWYRILLQINNYSSMEEILFRYNPWWEGDTGLTGIHDRPLMTQRMMHYASYRHIVFLTGLRRIGKTTLMRLFIRYLIENQRYEPKHVLYVSVDDYVLSKYTIIDIVERYRKIHRISSSQKITLFLDEVTYQKDFEKQLKTMVDSYNTKIYASSSSAGFIKRGKKYLTGRNIVIEVDPLDFEEYLQFRGINLKRSDKHLVDEYFEEYLEFGGIPEYVLTRDGQVIKELIDDIILKDIVAEHGIRDPQIIKDYFLLLMERAGKQMSINKVANILDISPDSSRRYLDLFTDTFLISLLPRCGKTNERILSQKKIYCRDTGIRTFYTGLRDKGSLFENYVYIRLKDNDLCYLYQDGIEIDFFTRKGELIEVKYQSKVTEKQLKLFNSVRAKKRFIITSYTDFLELNIS
jgi:uncharacterized protein